MYGEHLIIVMILYELLRIDCKTVLMQPAAHILDMCIALQNYLLIMFQLLITFHKNPANGVISHTSNNDNLHIILQTLQTVTQLCGDGILQTVLSDGFLCP